MKKEQKELWSMAELDDPSLAKESVEDRLRRAIGILEFRVNPHRKDLCTDDELRLIKGEPVKETHYEICPDCDTCISEGGECSCDLDL